MNLPGILIEPITDKNRRQAVDVIKKTWGSDVMVTRGVLHRLNELPGFTAREATEEVFTASIFYKITDNSCEIVVVHSLRREQGVGTALVEAVLTVSREAGCESVWLITTNDNVEAMRFWQKRGFLLRALHVDAVKYSRELKPELPLVGRHGIPIRDEIEFSVML